MDRKHIPVRTCAGCGIKVANRELIRIVFMPEWGVVVDVTGRIPGRGTYLCARLSCWETGINKGRVAHTLGHLVSSSEQESLLAYAYERFKILTFSQEQNG